MLTVNACEVSLTILLHSQPLRRFILGEAVKVEAVKANCKRQEREQECNRGVPTPVKAAILKRYSTQMHLVRRHSCANLNHFRYGIRFARRGIEVLPHLQFTQQP